MSVIDKFALTGQVAVITGAGAGIGKAIAHYFAQAGAAVVISDRDLSSAQQAAQEVIDQGGKAIGISCDVTSGADCMALIEAAISHFGKLTILVNNAGGGGPKPFHMPMEDFDWAYKLNVYAPFRLMQLSAHYIEKAGGGAVLNITSMAGDNTNQMMASYSSSKAAINHLTRNAAFDLGPMGIRVNGIAPGAIRTAALEKVLTPEIEKNMLKKTPLGRLGQAEDIAMAALFLCSPAASWVSGQILTVSGGGLQELD